MIVTRYPSSGEFDSISIGCSITATASYKPTSSSTGSATTTCRSSPGEVSPEDHELSFVEGEEFIVVGSLAYDDQDDHPNPGVRYYWVQRVGLPPGPMETSDDGDEVHRGGSSARYAGYVPGQYFVPTPIDFPGCTATATTSRAPRSPSRSVSSHAHEACHSPVPPPNHKFLGSASIAKLRSRLSISSRHSNPHTRSAAVDLLHPRGPTPQPMKALEPSAHRFPPLSSSSTSSAASSSPSSPSPLPASAQDGPQQQATCALKKALQLCGTIQQAYHAQSPFELDVQLGELVIIHAHLHREWLVCKPITRLAPPGLIPITHVQISDLKTGQILSPQRLKRLLDSELLPAQGEWLESRTAYQSSTISLGSFDHLPPPSSHAPPLSTPLSPGSRSPALRPQGSSDLVREWQRRQTDLPPRTPPSKLSPPSSPTTIDQLRTRYGTFVSAIAESPYEEDGQFWFPIRVRFAHCDRNHPSSRTLIIYRVYQDFVDFDRSLRFRLQSIPLPIPESLHLPPSEHLTPAYHPDDYRLGDLQLHHLSRYLGELSRAPTNVRELKEVYEVLAPGQHDIDLEGSSKASEILGDEVLEYLAEVYSSSPSEDGPADLTPPLASRATRINDQSFLSLTSSQSSSSQPHLYTQPDSQSSSDETSFVISTQLLQPASPSIRSSPLKSFYSSDGEFARIKVFDLESDDVIAFKVSLSTGLDELVMKISERLFGRSLSADPNDPCVASRRLVPKYEASQSLIHETSSSFGRLASITTDIELNDWMDSRGRYVLYV